MRITEASAIDALRCAMQLLIDEWCSELARRDPRVLDPAESVHLQPLVLRALAVVSRWTCVQWGCDAGWWCAPESQSAPSVQQLRQVGLSRLTDWAAPFDGLDAPRGATAGLAAVASDGGGRDSWHWVTVACERVRQDPDKGFEALVSTFELALQMVADVNDGRVTLRLGKANTAHTRRQSGSYYTPHRIVEFVLDQTLERALDEQEIEGGQFTSPLRVLDPACGAGLFLVAAAKRITARRIAHLDVAQREGAFGAAFVQTVRENLFGVDLNPLAVEWCRLWLWSCAGARDLEIATFAPGLRAGNAIVGAPRDYWWGAPVEAWKPTTGDDKAEARRLKARHVVELERKRLTAEPTSDAQRRLLADGWCAAFLSAKVSSPRADEGDAAPTYGALLAGGAVTESVAGVARRFRLFHWPLEFAAVFDGAGFDVVIGNPPWIAHAGRAAQAIEPHLKHYFLCNYASFSGYPTTHGLFVERAATLLRVGGRLGFVLPASVSELGGYEATRLAHDRWCDFDADLIDFGEGCFPGVTQPCMGLVSRRREGGRANGAPGQPWPMSREDLGELGCELLARLAALPVFEPKLFGERGVQSDPRMKAHLSAGDAPHGRFTTPVREGADIREFCLGRPKLWADWSALGRQARAKEEYELVRFVVRQTASFPIAALYDGLPFRNSLLAGFGSEQWEPASLVALLNSSLVRWHHYMRHRDARQPVLPQVKVGHLRAIPQPLNATEEQKRALARFTALAHERETTVNLAELDRTVAEMYGLSEPEAALVETWAESMLRRGRRSPSAPPASEPTPTVPAEG